MPVTTTRMPVHPLVQLSPQIILADFSQVCMEMVLVTPLTMVEPWLRHLSAHPVHMVDTVPPHHKPLLPAKLEMHLLVGTVDVVETHVAIQPVTACLVVKDLVQVPMVAAHLVAQLLAVASVDYSPVTVMAEMVLDSVADVAHLAAIHAATVQVWDMVLAAILVWVMAMVQDTLVWAPNWLAFSTGDLRSSGSPGLADLFP